MDLQEIEDLKAKLATTLKKAKAQGKIIEKEKLVTRTITVPAKGTVEGWSIRTPPATEQYWASKLQKEKKCLLFALDTAAT